MTHASPSWLPLALVWLALVALTGLSWLLSLAHLGNTDVAVALGIAVVKTALVVLFFMHLASERFSVVMIPGAAVFFIGLLLALVVTDVATRRTFPRAPAPDEGELPGVRE